MPIGVENFLGANRVMSGLGPFFCTAENVRFKNDIRKFQQLLRFQTGVF